MIDQPRGAAPQGQAPMNDDDLHVREKFMPPPPSPGGAPSPNANASASTGASASSSSPTAFKPTLFIPSDPTKFPRRQFLYGHNYARRYVGTIIAASDIGKTSLALTEFVAMASGKPLLGVYFKGPLKVWYWNGEDPHEEIERRVLAICKHYQIEREAIEGNLFLDSGRDMKLIVAQTLRTGFTIATPIQEALTKALIDNEIDILGIDPFVKTHRVSENDNTLMDAVVTVFAEIAEDANCATGLIQHTRKIGNNEATIEDGRGANSVVAATRMGRVINRMTKEEAERAEIEDDERRLHLRVDPAKSNMAPPQKATWFKLANVGLGNFGSEPGDEEDHVQVATVWKWPDALADVQVADLREVQRRTPEEPRRKDMRSPEWIGYLIIEVLGLSRDDKAHKARAAEMLATWTKNHMFKTVVQTDKKGMKREYVEVNLRA